MPLRYRSIAGSAPMHVAMVPMPRGRRRVDPHTHADFFEVVFTVDGAGEQWVGAAALPMRRGSLTLVRPRDRHGFAVPPRGHLRFINVAFPADTWQAFARLADIDAAGIDQAPLPPHIDVPAGELVELQAEFERALRAYSEGADRLHVIRLLAATLPLVTATVARPERTVTEPAWLARLCAEIGSEENLRAGMPRLREVAGVSRGHLARTMRHKLGTTPVRFLAERRLAHAAYLLTTTGESVTRISARCGFSSPSYFGQCFRAAYAVPPRDYRRRNWASVPAAPGRVR